MKNEEGTYKQGKFHSNKFKPKGPRVDPVRGSAQGTTLTALGNGKSNVIILLHENQLLKTSTQG